MREEFAFVAWEPHWMNETYNFECLEDSKGTLGALRALTDPSRTSRRSCAGVWRRKIRWPTPL
jgi:ABC-type proline/glycine betaine transport system substrate-binding protein